jgi:hypothetical protein
MSILDFLLPISVAFVLHVILVVVYSKFVFSRKFLLFLGANIGFIQGAWMVLLLGINRLPFILSFIILVANVLVSIQLVWIYSGLSKAKKRQR